MTKTPIGCRWCPFGGRTKDCKSRIPGMHGRVKGCLRKFWHWTRQGVVIDVDVDLR